MMSGRHTPVALLAFASLVLVGHEVSGQALPFLPEEIAKTLNVMRWEGAQWSANSYVKRKNYKGQAQTHKYKYLEVTDTFRKQCKGLLSAKTVDDVCGLFSSAIWYEAHSRNGNGKAKNEQQQEMQKYENALIHSGELKPDLVKFIKEMAIKTTGLISCLRKYRIKKKGDRKCDPLRRESDYYYTKLPGTPILSDVIFDTQKAQYPGKVIDKILLSEEINNEGSHPMHIKKMYQEKKGETTYMSESFSYTISMSYSMTAKFSIFLASARTSFGYEATIKKSTHFSKRSLEEKEIKKHYEFTVAGGEHLRIVAIQKTQEVVVPYFTVLDFDGVKKNVTGTWKGKAMSNVFIENKLLRPASARYIYMSDVLTIIII